MTEAMKLETTEEALRNALAWYGEQARLARLIHSEGDPGRWALAEDGGKRAREALALVSPVKAGAWRAYGACVVFDGGGFDVGGCPDPEQLAAFIVEAVNSHTAALSASPAGVVKPLQSRVQPWMMACFGPEISADKLERSDRFIEEALELVQSGDYPKERVLALVDYVYGRDKGEMPQEVGGVMITLAAFCLAHDIDMHEAGETELARIWTKVEKIRAKQAAKPTGSALPVAARIMSAIEPAGVGVETAPPKTQVAVDVEAKALKAVEDIFADLRDRRFLKWLFDRDGDVNLIGRFDNGEELRGIDLEAQAEIKADWQAIIAKALSSTEGKDNG